MNADRFLAYYEQVADASDVVARLRRFILDLAVRGKLVPQDADDEPVLELLKRSKIPFSSTWPFELPRTWAWVRVGDVSEARLGKMLDKNKNKGVPRPYLRNINVRWFDFDLSNLLMMPFEAAELEEFALQAGDVLICEGGEPGRAAVWDERSRNIYFQKALHRVRFTAFVDPTFFVNALKSSVDDGRLAESFTGAGIMHFTGRSLSSYLFPLPPLTEQHRIVAKVDELMGLCDRLEAARADRETVRDRLAAASLGRLNAPETTVPATATSPVPEASHAFADHARFVLDALPALTVRPDQVKALRQTIFNLAVRGKLVQQNTNEEPAFELLKRIASEVTAYSNENRVNRAKTDPIEDNNLPFTAPAGWEWTRLSSLFNVITDGDHQPPPKADEGVAFLTISNITTGKINFNNCHLVSGSYFNSIAAYRTPAKGDILYTVVGATYGRPALVETDRAFCVQRHIAILKPVQVMSLRYLNTLLTSPLIYDQATRSLTGTAQPTIGLRPLRNFLAPLPPLAEQHRIVAKVDELMALCDRLEASLTAAADTRRRLLDALLAEALAPDEDRLREAAE